MQQFSHGWWWLESGGFCTWRVWSWGEDDWRLVRVSTNKKKYYIYGSEFRNRKGIALGTENEIWLIVFMISLHCFSLLLNRLLNSPCRKWNKMVIMIVEHLCKSDDAKKNKIHLHLYHYDDVTKFFLKSATIDRYLYLMMPKTNLIDATKFHLMNLLPVLLLLN